jgi:hypothetical protein
VEVTVDIGGRKPGKWSQELKSWSQELKSLGHRNRFTPLLKASDPLGASPELSIWSRALAKVVIEPDILFHVLRNKTTLDGSVSDSKKRRRDDE